jgi:hypothetical protein
MGLGRLITAATAAEPAPSTATAPTTARATATAVAAAAPTATAAFTGGPRLIHNNIAPHEVMTVQSLNGTPGVFVIIHFHEAKSARLSGESVTHQCYIGR